ncbi:hypothetical protein BH11PLA1_BH11PLA1_14180 [soil metagenome]
MNTGRGTPARPATSRARAESDPVPTPAPVAADPNAWTTRRLLAWLQDALKSKGIESPRLCTEILLGHVLGAPRIKLYTEPERIWTDPQRDTLRALASRALRHEPVQYLVGEAWFFGMALNADRRALIPRPCTEMIVEEAIQFARRLHAQSTAPAHADGTDNRVADPGAGAVTRGEDLPDEDAQQRALHRAERAALDSAKRRRQTLGQNLLIADLCTGSGCIAIAIAKHLPGARLVATDISPDALALAAENAARAAVSDRLDFTLGDLLAPLLGQGHGPFDILCANPPYIPDHEWEAVPANVRNFEPTLALRAGPTGLELVTPIIDQAIRFLKPGGLLLIEIAACTGALVLEHARSTGQFARVEVKNDLEGKPRMLRAVLREI